jgi:uncharacterized protein YkwD
VFSLREPASGHRRVRHRRRLVTAVASVAVLLCLAVVTPAVITPAAIAPAQASTTTDEAALVASVNAARRAAGLAPLKVSSDLRSYARAHSAAMRSRGSLFHTSDFSVVCCWAKIAENVGTGRSPSTVHRAFMNSRGHRANILMASADEIGIGVVRDSSGALWVTELFRDRPGVRATRLPAEPAPTSAAERPSLPSRSRARTAPPVDPTAARVSQAAKALGPAYRDPVRAAIDWLDAMSLICR